MGKNNEYMVRTIENSSVMILYQCEVCGYRYEDKVYAEKCEAWCKERRSCNLEIIAHGTPSDTK